RMMSPAESEQVEDRLIDLTLEPKALAEHAMRIGDHPARLGGFQGLLQTQLRPAAEPQVEQSTVVVEPLDEVAGGKSEQDTRAVGVVLAAVGVDANPVAPSRATPQVDEPEVDRLDLLLFVVGYPAVEPRGEQLAVGDVLLAQPVVG